MNRCALLAVTLALSATTALAADGTFDKTLTFAGAPIVSVSTGAGYVHVYPGPDNQLHLIGRLHSHSGWLFGSDDDADKRIRQIIANPPILQSGNIVTIGSAHGSDLYRNITIDYDILTPRVTTLKAESGSGNLEIGGIEAPVTGQTGSGNIHVDNIGANSHLNTGSGDINATNLHGAATAQTGSGNLDLSLDAAGDVTAKTGSGNIHVDGASAGLHTSAGSGNIDVTGSPSADWRIETGSGDVRITPGQSAHFTLNADTGSGDILVNRPIVMQASPNRHHVFGNVNGGGTTLKVSTGSGNIEVN